MRLENTQNPPHVGSGRKDFCPEICVLREEVFNFPSRICVTQNLCDTPSSSLTLLSSPASAPCSAPENIWFLLVIPGASAEGRCFLSSPASPQGVVILGGPSGSEILWCASKVTDQLVLARCGLTEVSMRSCRYKRVKNKNKPTNKELTPENSIIKYPCGF